MTGDDRPAGEDARTTDRDDDGETRTEADRPTTDAMTDTDPDAIETDEPIAAAETAGEPSAEPTGPSPSTDGGVGRLSTERLRGILDRVGLAALVLLALIAGWGFYSQTGAAIRTWLDPAYQPIALAAFNLAILLVALAGVSYQLSRIRADE